MKRFLSITALLALFVTLQAATVDTLTVFSPSMKKNTKTCVVVPDGYRKSAQNYPVLYLLHGYSGNYASWVKDFPQVLGFADTYNMIIVGVDGAFSSWYFDSPVDSTFKYETYVTRELTGFIDKTYRTVKEAKGRAACGLSMGGHGALYLAMRNQQVFGAAGSMSGGVDIRPFPENWDLSKRLGDKALYPENWEKHTVINQLHLLKNDKLALMIDCGIDDFFYPVNRALHEKMLYLNIKHDYIERPGAHNWAYWNNALQYQVLFFYNYFQKNLSK